MRTTLTAYQACQTGAMSCGGPDLAGMTDMPMSGVLKRALADQ